MHRMYFVTAAGFVIVVYQCVKCLQSISSCWLLWDPEHANLIRLQVLPHPMSTAGGVVLTTHSTARAHRNFVTLIHVVFCFIAFPFFSERSKASKKVKQAPVAPSAAATLTSSAAETTATTGGLSTTADSTAGNSTQLASSSVQSSVQNSAASSSCS